MPFHIPDTRNACEFGRQPELPVVLASLLCLLAFSSVSRLHPAYRIGIMVGIGHDGGLHLIRRMVPTLVDRPGIPRSHFARGLPHCRSSREPSADSLPSSKNQAVAVPSQNWRGLQVSSDSGSRGIQPCPAHREDANTDRNDPAANGEVRRSALGKGDRCQGAPGLADHLICCVRVMGWHQAVIGEGCSCSSRNLSPRGERQRPGVAASACSRIPLPRRDGLF